MRDVTFQKRHMEVIAATLKSAKPRHHPSSEASTQWRNEVDNFVRLMAASNERFDRDRFLAACGADHG